MTDQAWINSVQQYKEELKAIVDHFTEDSEGFIKALEERSVHDLNKILKEAWRAAPDRGHIHTIPGWGALCELLLDRLEV